MKKIAIIYGNYEKQKKAVEILTEIIVEFLHSYPACVEYGKEVSADIKIYIGTANDNEFIKKNSTNNLVHREEYGICVKNNTVIIEGSDDAGVLYGCVDFYNKYILNCEYPESFHLKCENPFENDLPDFEYSSYPKISNRGIWTWGHVIYDYKGFIDNMVRLKMNSVVIWNDVVPVNAKEMVDYAHEVGIKVIWGYSWFWDTDCKKIDVQSVYDGIDDILKKYEDEYLPLGGDGIYFQSFTEVHTEDIGGILVAEAVTNFVNATSDKFFEKYPGIELQFGLHATSVKEKLEYIKNVNPGVRIVWEDCGAFPFAYIPSKTDGFDETLELTEKIAVLRGNDDRFGVVTKGISNLDWSEFVHLEEPIYFGVSSKFMRKERVLKKQKNWKYIQSYWMTNVGFAREAMKVMSDKKNGELYALGLVEDGMFEETIMFPVALYAEILWNPYEETNKIINEVALRNYVEFA